MTGHRAALRVVFDRLVNRRVGVLDPSSSAKGVKKQVSDGRTPGIGVEQGRKLLASMDCGNVVGFRDQAIVATLAHTGCRTAAVARIRLGLLP
jgi:site-specific recombinase XerD